MHHYFPIGKNVEHRRVSTPTQEQSRYPGLRGNERTINRQKQVGMLRGGGRFLGLCPAL